MHDPTAREQAANQTCSQLWIKQPSVRRISPGFCTRNFAFVFKCCCFVLLLNTIFTLAR